MVKLISIGEWNKNYKYLIFYLISEVIYEGLSRYELSPIYNRVKIFQENSQNSLTDNSNHYFN